MDRNKEILKHCPHFYTIINFEYYSDDIISEKLLDIYQKYIFSVDIDNIENVKKIEKLDRVMFRYINDFVFRKEVKKGRSPRQADEKATYAGLNRVDAA